MGRSSPILPMTATGPNPFDPLPWGRNSDEVDRDRPALRVGCDGMVGMIRREEFRIWLLRVSTE